MRTIIIKYASCNIKQLVQVIIEARHDETYFCICKNIGTGLLRLCFHFIDNTIPLLTYSEISIASQPLLLCSADCVSPGRQPRG